MHTIISLNAEDCTHFEMDGFLNGQKSLEMKFQYVLYFQLFMRNQFITIITSSSPNIQKKSGLQGYTWIWIRYDGNDKPVFNKDMKAFYTCLEN